MSDAVIQEEELDMNLEVLGRLFFPHLLPKYQKRVILDLVKIKLKESEICNSLATSDSSLQD
jgi:hypothetical protein